MRARCCLVAHDHDDSWYGKVVEAVAKRRGFKTNVPSGQVWPRRYLELTLLNAPRSEKVRIGYRHEGHTNYYTRPSKGCCPHRAPLPRDGLGVCQDRAREVHGCAAAHLQRHAIEAGGAERHRRWANIAEVSRNRHRLAAWAEVLPNRLSERERTIGRQVLKEIRSRLGSWSMSPGLPHDHRTSSTLSAAAQRIRLATQIARA